MNWTEDRKIREIEKTNSGLSAVFSRDLKKYGINFMAAILLCCLLSGCSAKEESAKEIPSLDWEKIEESADNGESVMEESAAEQTTENVSSESEDNAAGSITDKAGSEISVDELADAGNSMPAAYREIINTICEAMKNQGDAVLDMDTSYIPAEYYQGDSIGYTMLDINEDGTEELLLETKSEQYEDSGFIYAMFTLQNEDAVELFNYGGARNRYYVCTDGTVKNEGSSGAAYSSWAYYKLVGTELVLQECVFTSPDEEDITRACSYYTTTEPYEDFSTEITEEQVAEIQDRYTERELSMTVLE